MTSKFTIKMKPRRNLYGIHNDFSGVGGGLTRGCVLIRNRDGDDDVPCTCTHVRRYAKGCFLHLHTCLMLRHGMFFVGLGWGWGQVSSHRAKNTKCRSFPPAFPLHTYTRAWLTTGDVHYPPHAKQNLVPSLPCCHTALRTCYC